MNSHHPSPATLAAAPKGPHAPTRRGIDPIDEPARSLGSKRAALQARRHERTAVELLANQAQRNPGGPTLLSKAARVAFALHATHNGLLIERTQQRLDGTRLVQALAFADPPTFDRWCESDPIRFQDPLLYEHLRRRGHEAFTRDR